MSEEEEKEQLDWDEFWDKEEEKLKQEMKEEEKKLAQEMKEEELEESPEEKFVSLKVIRGFTEIAHIYDIAYSFYSHICGGYVRYMCSPTTDPVPAGDIDIFPPDQNGYENNLKSFELHGYTIKHENDISTTLNNPEGIYSPTVQLIKPIEEGRVVTVGDITKVIDNFDFTVVRIGLIDPVTAIADPDFEKDEKNKTLVFKNIHCPISSLLRACKYAKKGYFLRPFEALKLFVDWEDRDDEYRLRIQTLFQTSFDMDEDGNPIISQKEIDELEALLRID